MRPVQIFYVKMEEAATITKKLTKLFVSVKQIILESSVKVSQLLLRTVGFAISMKKQEKVDIHTTDVHEMKGFNIFPG